LYQPPGSRIRGEIDGKLHDVPQQKAIGIRCVCVPCNTGWMNELQNLARRAVQAMASDLSFRLTEPTQIAVAHWAVLRAMVWDFASTQSPLFFTDTDRWLCRRHRHIPPHTVVWIARNATGETFFSQGTYTKTAEPPQRDVFVVTIAYNRFVAQVLSVELEDGVNVPFDAFDNPTIRYRDAVAQVWPTRTHVHWPPPVSVGPWRLHTRAMVNAPTF